MAFSKPSVDVTVNDKAEAWPITRSRWTAVRWAHRIPESTPASAHTTCASDRGSTPASAPKSVFLPWDPARSRNMDCQSSTAIPGVGITFRGTYSRSSRLRETVPERSRTAGPDRPL